MMLYFSFQVLGCLFLASSLSVEGATVKSQKASGLIKTQLRANDITPTLCNLECFDSFFHNCSIQHNCSFCEDVLFNKIKYPQSQQTVWPFCQQGMDCVNYDDSNASINRTATNFCASALGTSRRGFWSAVKCLFGLCSHVDDLETNLLPPQQLPPPDIDPVHNPSNPNDDDPLDSSDPEQEINWGALMEEQADRCASAQTVAHAARAAYQSWHLLEPDDERSGSEMRIGRELKEIADGLEQAAANLQRATEMNIAVQPPGATETVVHGPAAEQENMQEFMDEQAALMNLIQSANDAASSGCQTQEQLTQCNIAARNLAMAGARGVARNCCMPTGAHSMRRHNITDKYPCCSCPDSKTKSVPVMPKPQPKTKPTDELNDDQEGWWNSLFTSFWFHGAECTVFFCPNDRR